MLIDPACQRCCWFAACNGNLCGWKPSKPRNGSKLRRKTQKEKKHVYGGH